MENITVDLAHFNTITYTSSHVWLVLGTSDNYEIRVEIIIYIAQLHLVELTAEFSKFQGYKFIGTKRRQFVKFETAVGTEPKM